jgi:hypothetical protein
MIPDTLDGWTMDIVRAIVEQGVFETDRFDFKEMLPHPSYEEGKRRLRRDLAAFANSVGGFLAFGVKDDKGLSAQERIVGLVSTHDFPEQFGNYPAGCEPSVDWTFKNPPIVCGPERVVHVVHVLPSDRRPHGLFEDGRWWFTKRTNKGTEPLSYAELRGLFTDAEQRRSNLLLFTAELERIRKLAEQQAMASSRSTDQFVGVRYNTARVEAVLPFIFGVLSGNTWLVGNVNELRNVAQEADAWLAGVSPYVTLDPWKQSALRQKVAEDARRVMNSAERALTQLERLRA